VILSPIVDQRNIRRTTKYISTVALIFNFLSFCSFLNVKNINRRLYKNLPVNKLKKIIRTQKVDNWCVKIMSKIDNMTKLENILFFSRIKQNKERIKRQCTRELVLMFVKPLTNSISEILTNKTAINPAFTPESSLTIRKVNRLIITVKGITIDKKSAILREDTPKTVPAEDTKICHNGVYIYFDGTTLWLGT
jgi:hypothetical protein